MDNKLVLLGFLILLVLYIGSRLNLDLYKTGTENLNNTSVTSVITTKSLLPSDDIIANNVYEYIKSTDEDFQEYIHFLNKIKNTNLKLIASSVFYELKTLKKYNNLDKKNILRIMTSS